tara:strand:+ start:574 stop:1509 length:936 start_codon:yes stop_codon:yes gene_type:complete
MHILITGASGFLGRNLCAALEKKKNYKLTKINSQNCDLTKEANLFKYNKINFKYIFHLAAWIQGGSFAQENTSEVWIRNQKINTNLISWISKYQKKSKIITIGSSGSYDPKHKLIEDNYLIGEPHKSLYSYGMTKRMLLIGLKSLNHQYGNRYINFVPSTIYGPNYHTNKRKVQFIYDLIHKILDGKYKQKKVILWGDGKQKRELIYINDLIKIILKLHNKIENLTINVSPDKSLNISDYAKIICKELDFNFKKITYDKSKFVGTKNRSIKNQKLLNYINDIKFTNVEDGIINTINWYKKNIYFRKKYNGK